MQGAEIALKRVNMQITESERQDLDKISQVLLIGDCHPMSFERVQARRTTHPNHNENYPEALDWKVELESLPQACIKVHTFCIDSKKMYSLQTIKDFQTIAMLKPPFST